MTPGTTTDKPYNHYSFLRTIEDLFGLSPLGYAGRSTAFGSDVFNAPPAAAAAARCRSTKLGRRGNLGAGTLIAGVQRSGRAVRVRMAHTARVQFNADGRRVSTRDARACQTATFRAPAGTRHALVKATVRGARELRTLRFR